MPCFLTTKQGFCKNYIICQPSLVPKPIRMGLGTRLMLALFLDLSNRQVKYSVYMKNSILTLSSFPGVGVRILCSKIRELCYALMLTIYANYAPQISHYAPEKKYTIMLLSKIIFFGQKNTFSHRTVTKHIERLQNSRIETKCH